MAVLWASLSLRLSARPPVTGLADVRGWHKLLLPLFIFLLCGALVMGGCASPPVTKTVVQPLLIIREYHYINTDNGCGEVQDCWYEPDDGPGET